MLTRDDINSLLIQIKGYVDSSNAVLKKELIEYLSAKNQEMKNYVDHRMKNNEANVVEQIDKKMEIQKNEISKLINNYNHKTQSDINNNFAVLNTILNEFKSLRKDLTELKRKALENESKFKNIKNII